MFSLFSSLCGSPLACFSKLKIEPGICRSEDCQPSAHGNAGEHPYSCSLLIRSLQRHPVDSAQHTYDVLVPSQLPDCRFLEYFSWRSGSFLDGFVQRQQFNQDGHGIFRTHANRREDRKSAGSKGEGDTGAGDGRDGHPPTGEPASATSKSGAGGGSHRVFDPTTKVRTALNLYNVVRYYNKVASYTLRLSNLTKRKILGARGLATNHPPPLASNRRLQTVARRSRSRESDFVSCFSSTPGHHRSRS